MLFVNGITKKFGSRLAVENINWSAQKGEVLGILGPNGAGKSTTIKLILGLLSPDSGSITFNGKTRGYLPENPPVYLDMTVESYMQFVAKIKNIFFTEAASEIDRVINLMELADSKKRVIKNLSKGYIQRLGIAQAIMGSPDLIILDEPTSALDPRQSYEVRQLIKSLKLKSTVIFSTHILSEAESVCDSVVIMKQGKVVAQDNLSSLKKNRQNKQHYFVKVKSFNQNIKKIVSAWPFIEDIRWDNQADGFMIDIKQGEDIETHSLIQKMISQQIVIEEVRPITPSMEEIFMEATK